MITPRHACATLLAGSALMLAACSLSRFVQKPPELELRDDVVTIGFDSGARTLLFRLREPGGDVAMLRATGVTLVLEDAGQPRPQRVGFGSAKVVGSRLHIACDPVPDHEITIDVASLGAGRCDVRLADLVAARSLVRELRLDYEVTLDPLDETFLPALQPEGAAAIGDDAFHVPLVFARSGRRALTLVPDLELLQHERPLPQALEFDLRRLPAQLGHGFVATRATAEGFLREGAPPALARGEVLTFGHELAFLQNALPHASLAEAAAGVWRTTPPDADARIHALVAEESRTRLVTRFASARRNEAFDPDTLLTAALRDIGDGALLAPQSGLLLAARAFGERFAATGEVATGALAAALCEVALAAPRRAGLFPTACRNGPEGSTPRWRFADTARERYHAAEIALAYRELARAAQGLANDPSSRPLRERIDRNIGEAARFFTSNQLVGGAIPAWYESQYLVPEKGSREIAAETACVALLLAEFGLRTRDPTALSAARRALGFVQDGALRTNAWADAGCADRPADVRGGQPFRRTVPIACAALATVALHEATGDPGLVPVVDALLDQLALLQATWSPVWQSASAQGAVLVGNDSLATAPAVQALAIEAFFAGFRTNGRRQHLQRGAAALRWLARDREGTRSSLALDAARVAALESVARTFGQVVVDPERGYAEGLDALAVTDLTLDGRTVRIRLSTEQPALRTARATFAVAQPHLTPFELSAEAGATTVLGAEQLARGVDVPVTTLPGVRFLPPSEIAVTTPWFPRALVTRPMIEGWRFGIEIRASGAPATTLPLEPVAGEPWLVALEPFDPRGLAPGVRIEARLVGSGEGRTLSDPRLGTRIVALAENQCLDPGDDDERALQGGVDSEVRRSDDGRENARAVHGTGSFTYRLEVPREATQLHLRLRIAGLASISSGTVELHRDTLDSERELRDEDVVLADRRLWSRGSLALTFRCADPRDARGLALAKLRFRSEGNAVATPAAEAIGASFRPRGVDPHCALLVLPLALADRPLRADGEQVRQAFFGGPEYRMTPPPAASRTAGSVAELVTAMSGSRTLLEGTVLPERASPLLASDLAEMVTPQQALLASLGGIDPPPGTLPDAIVVVVAGGPIRPELDGGSLKLRDAFPNASAKLAEVPILFVAERGSDGSFFASGHALAGLIFARYGLPDSSRPELGNFGELSLSSSRNRHLPSGIIGVNLARLGWCDQLTLPFESRRDLPIAPLHDGRTFYELPSPFPMRGSLIVESRAASRAEPGLGASGLLLYWSFAEGAPWIVLANGQRIAPRLLRLSPQTPTFLTPFREAVAKTDLFQAECDLDESGTPSLATIAGEGLWRVHRRSVATGDKLAVEFLGHDLSQPRDPGFLRDGATPVRNDQSRAPASGGILDGKIELTGATAPGPTIGAVVVPDVPALGPCRLMAHFVVAAVPESAELLVAFGGNEARCELGTRTPGAFWCELDADRFAPGDRVTVTLAPSRGAAARVRIDQLWIVPRAPVLSAVAPDHAALHSLRMHDGTVVGAAFTVPAPTPAQPHFRVPTLWPKGTTWLRLRLAVPWDGPAVVTSKLTIALHARDGRRSATLCSALPWRVERGVDAMTTLILQVPANEIPGVAWLEFVSEGSPLEIVGCEILRE